MLTFSRTHCKNWFKRSTSSQCLAGQRNYGVPSKWRRKMPEPSPQMSCSPLSRHLASITPIPSTPHCIATWLFTVLTFPQCLITEYEVAIFYWINSNWWFSSIVDVGDRLRMSERHKQTILISTFINICKFSSRSSPFLMALPTTDLSFCAFIQELKAIRTPAAHVGFFLY